MRSVALAALVLGLALAATGAAAEAGPAEAACPPQALSDGYTRSVMRALASPEDVWGNELLAAPGGPTEAGARRYLAPLLLAGGPRKRPLTESGFHYVAFAQPDRIGGTSSAALNVADGSQVLAQRVDGPRLTVLVGARGDERYGSCRSRLGGPRLGSGYLPILLTTYRDRDGASYSQESFAARAVGGLASFVRITADARRARGDVAVVLRASAGTNLRYVVRRGHVRTLRVAWTADRLVPWSERSYRAARAAVTEYWRGRLAEGAELVVPEPKVMDAQRALLIQSLVLTWRYSIGNPYQQFSFPEGTDVSRVLGELGYAGVAQAIVRTSLTRSPEPYANWKRGQKLVAAASAYRLARDRRFVAEVTPALREYVEILGGQIEAGPRGLLDRERYSSDIPDTVYGLHAQAVVWQGLVEMAQVWSVTGETELAARCRRLAARLERGLREAVRASQRRLPDGSLFLPAQLLGEERPYGSLTETRLGSYWNLVVPYALASGLFAPGSPEAEGAWRYMLLHGSRLLGLVRAGAYALYTDPVHPVSGTDQVYGINVARFLADLDEPDHIVLSLYGMLAASMTPGTFVAGEAASVAPLGDAYARSM